MFYRFYLSFMLQKNPHTSYVDFRKIGGSQCLFLHTLHSDRHSVEYNIVAIVSNSFCNIKGYFRRRNSL